MPFAATWMNTRDYHTKWSQTKTNIIWYHLHVESKKKNDTNELIYKMVIPSDCREIQPVHPKGNQSWMFIGGTDVEAETPILWPPDAKSWLIGKDPDAWKDWRREEKGTTQDEMVGWHHRLNGHEFEWTPGGGDGQGGLVCCSSWGRKESDTTERLNWTEWYKRTMWFVWTSE